MWQSKSYNRFTNKNGDYDLVSYGDHVIEPDLYETDKPVQLRTTKVHFK